MRFDKLFILFLLLVVSTLSFGQGRINITNGIQQCTHNNIPVNFGGIPVGGCVIYTDLLGQQRYGFDSSYLDGTNLVRIITAVENPAEVLFTDTVDLSGLAGGNDIRVSDSWCDHDTFFIERTDNSGILDTLIVPGVPCSRDTCDLSINVLSVDEIEIIYCGVPVDTIPQIHIGNSDLTTTDNNRTLTLKKNFFFLDEVGMANHIWIALEEPYAFMELKGIDDSHFTVFSDTASARITITANKNINRDSLDYAELKFNNPSVDWIWKLTYDNNFQLLNQYVSGFTLITDTIVSILNSTKDFNHHTEVFLLNTNTVDNTLDSILVRDFATGQIKLRSAGTLGGGGADGNFAQNNLTANANRSHDWDNFDLSITDINQLVLSATDIGLNAVNNLDINVDILNLVNAPVLNNAADSILVRNNDTGDIELRSASSIGGGSDTNFAEDDLTVTGNRTHAFATNNMTFSDVGTFQITNVTAASTLLVNSSGYSMATGNGNIFIGATVGTIATLSVNLDLNADDIILDAPDIFLEDVLTEDNTQEDILVRNSTTGEIQSRDVATIGGGTDTNFAEDNLTATGDRAHDFATFDLDIGNIDTLFFSANKIRAFGLDGILFTSVTGDFDFATTLGNIELNANGFGASIDIVSPTVDITASAVTSIVTADLIIDAPDIIFVDPLTIDTWDTILVRHPVTGEIQGRLASTLGGGSDTNFALDDLTADANRSHDFDGFDLGIIDLGDFSITATDVLFTSPLVNIVGDMTITEATPSISFIDTDLGHEDFMVLADVNNFVIRNITDARDDIIIDSDGRVGIGAAAPSEAKVFIYGGSTGANLDIRGDTDMKTSTVEVQAYDFGTSFKSAYLQFIADGIAGNVIDAIPNADLGRLAFQNVDNALIYTINAAPLIFGTDFTEVGRFNPSGEFQLGSVSDLGDFKLQLSGSMIISDSINIVNPPILNNAADSILVWNNATGFVELRSASASFSIHDPVTLSGTPDYITLSGQDIIRGQIDLTSDITGSLPVANNTTFTEHRILFTDATTGKPTVNGTWNSTSGMSLYNNTTKYIEFINTNIGIGSGVVNGTGDNRNVVIGHGAGGNPVGGWSTIVGYGAGGNKAVGNIWNTLIGYQTGANLNAGVFLASYNTLVGHGAGLSLTTGNSNLWLQGYSQTVAASNITTGAYNIILGYSTAALANTASSIYIGNNAGTNFTGNNNFAIDNNTAATALTDKFMYGDLLNDSLFLNSVVTIRDIPHYGTPDSVLVIGPGRVISKFHIDSISGGGGGGGSDGNFAEDNLTANANRTHDFDNFDLSIFDIGALSLTAIDDITLETTGAGTDIYLTAIDRVIVDNLAFVGSATDPQILATNDLTILSSGSVALTLGSNGIIDLIDNTKIGANSGQQLEIVTSASDVRIGNDGAFANTYIGFNNSSDIHLIADDTIFFNSDELKIVNAPIVNNSADSVLVRTNGVVELRLASTLSGGGSDGNFAEDDLIADGNRTHDFDGFFLSIFDLDSLSIHADDSIFMNTANGSIVLNAPTEDIILQTGGTGDIYLTTTAAGPASNADIIITSVGDDILMSALDLIELAADNAVELELSATQFQFMENQTTWTSTGTTDFIYTIDTEDDIFIYLNNEHGASKSSYINFVGDVATFFLGLNGTSDAFSFVRGSDIIYAIDWTTGVTNFQFNVEVPNQAYGAGWDGSNQVATKNAIYDKIETITGDGLGTAFTANRILLGNGATTGTTSADLTFASNVLTVHKSTTSGSSQVVISAVTGADAYLKILVPNGINDNAYINFEKTSVANWQFGIRDNSTANVSIYNTVDLNIVTFGHGSTEGVSFFKQAYFVQGTLTDGATINWNLNTQQVASVTLGGNRTLANPTNMKAGAHYTVTIKQDGGGNRTLGFSSAYKFPGGVAPTLSTGANDVDVMSCVSDGTNMYCNLLNDYN